MFTQKIVFKSIDEINKFLHIAESVDFEIDLAHFSCVVDGKSMLGILGFGLGQVLELRLLTQDGAEASQFMARVNFCLYQPEKTMVM